MLSKDPREAALYAWAAKTLKQPALSWHHLTGDAGGRHYFRIPTDNITYLAVDSPLNEVDNPRFIALAESLQKAGLHAPCIYAADLTQGFLLINELSTQHYLDVLTPQNADKLYVDAMQALIQLQKSEDFFTVKIYPWKVEDYYTELTDMVLWLFNQHFKILLTTQQECALTQIFHNLIQNMQDQPQVMVHRDYHSRNLLYCASHNPGIIDFQDIFLGPITYDLVSLLRDAYITWPWAQVEQWVQKFYFMLIEQPAYKNVDYTQLVKWFHGMTLQRAIKVLGRFARLCYRDHKPRYLADLPRVAEYVLISAQHYPGVAVLEDILQQEIMPRLQAGETCAQ